MKCAPDERGGPAGAGPPRIAATTGSVQLRQLRLHRERPVEVGDERGVVVEADVQHRGAAVAQVLVVDLDFQAAPDSVRRREVVDDAARQHHVHLGDVEPERVDLAGRHADRRAAAERGEDLGAGRGGPQRHQIEGLRAGAEDPPALAARAVVVGVLVVGGGGRGLVLASVHRLLSVVVEAHFADGDLELGDVVDGGIGEGRPDLRALAAGSGEDQQGSARDAQFGHFLPPEVRDCSKTPKGRLRTHAHPRRPLRPAMDAFFLPLAYRRGPVSLPGVSSRLFVSAASGLVLPTKSASFSSSSAASSSGASTLISRARTLASDCRVPATFTVSPVFRSARVMLALPFSISVCASTATVRPEILRIFFVRSMDSMVPWNFSLLLPSTEALEPETRTRMVRLSPLRRPESWMASSTPDPWMRRVASPAGNWARRKCPPASIVVASDTG